MTTGQSVKPVRISYIQALRGLAALWVVFYHAREHTPSFGWLFDSGHYGVAIFFALSGFVIMHSIANAEELSLSGRLASRHADVVLTQWSHLACPGVAEYRGAVI